MDGPSCGPLLRERSLSSISHAQILLLQDLPTGDTLPLQHPKELSHDRLRPVLPVHQVHSLHAQVQNRKRDHIGADGRWEVRCDRSEGFLELAVIYRRPSINRQHLQMHQIYGWPRFVLHHLCPPLQMPL